MEQGFRVEFYASVKYINKISSKLTVFQLSAFHYGWVNIGGRAFNDNVDKVANLSDGTWIKGTGSLTINEWTNKNGENIKDLQLTVNDFETTSAPQLGDKSKKGNTSSYKKNTQSQSQNQTRASKVKDDIEDDLPF